VIKIGWAVYKALSGAYKYAITQTFAIPTIDDAEKSKFTSSGTENDNNENIITENGILNENKIDEILGSPDENDFEALFELGKMAG
jgi:hypothetical protein